VKVKRQHIIPRNHIASAIRDVQEKVARVGFFEHSKYPDGTPVAYVATIQEFGHGAIPARPFFRPTINEQRNAWRNSLARGYKAVIGGKLTVEHMLFQLGAQAAGQVRRTISKIQNPPLSEATIKGRQSRRKGKGVSTKPLVDTGYMVQSVSNDVVTK
jgi:hypothetical protein